MILVGNHANQFVDAIMMVCTCEHKISYLIAEKSWNRRVVGDMAWALGAVPVKRAQDYSVKGSGKITMNKLDFGEKEGSTGAGVILVTGHNTIFTKELTIGDKVRPPGTAIAMKVIEIENDTSLSVEAVGTESLTLPEQPVSFDILQRIDQKVVYGKVLETLASKGAIGIFPEGGSHDRTDILPLKVGVALIAYSALEKDGISVPIIPVGLNYFQKNRFRGRAVVEYGQPVYIDPSTLSAYQEGGPEKRRVCSELLQRIEDGMKSVLVTAPNYESLQVIYAARRLWQQKELLISEKQDLSRRFAEGYKQLLMQVNGKPPKEWSDLNDRIVSYQNELTELGIRDYQVPGLDSKKGEIQSVEDLDGDTFLSGMRLPYQICHVLFLMLVAAIPSVLLNLPVGLVARIYAEKRRKKALANSKVKIKAEDVLMTEKILICIVLVPTLWFFYAFMLKCFTNLDGPAIALIFFCMPLFSYMRYVRFDIFMIVVFYLSNRIFIFVRPNSIMWAEAGMVEFKDLRPYVMRLYPSARRRIAALPERRKKLSNDVRAFIKEHGPSLGELYYSEDIDWNKMSVKARNLSKKDLKGE